MNISIRMIATLKAYRVCNVSKNVLSNLINRQFRDYFNESVDSKGLHFDVISGIASVKRVDLNVAHINEVLAEHGLVHICEGYIEEVTLKLSNVLTEGIEISINGLQVTLNPLRQMNDSDTRQLVESVTKTLAEGIVLDKETTAECFDDFGSDLADNGAAGQFASVIDQFLSKVKIVFKDAEIRIESDRAVNGPQVGLEIRIEHMEFLDDHSKPLKKPDSGELQKVLNITNVRLYTDIFSPMHSSTSTVSSVDGEKLPSNIVQFAHLSGKHTVKIGVENLRLPGVDGVMSKKTQIDLNSEGSIFFMLTPTQIVLLKSLLSQLGPKPKNPDSIPPTPMEEAVNTMYTSRTAKQQPRNSNQLQSMSSSFIPAAPVVDLLDLSLDEISFSQPHRSVPAPSVCGNDDDEFCNIQMSEISDHISFSLHASSIYGIITHEDPLSKTNIEKTYEEGSNVQDVIEIMRTDADIFFNIIPTMNMSSTNELQRQKHIFDKAFNGDHLRFTLQDAVIHHKFETDGFNSHVNASALFKKIQLRESLTKDSIFGVNQGDVISILNFNDESGLQMILKSSWRCGFAREHFIDVSVPDLKIIVDPSIIDRLSNLIVTDPYFQFSESEAKHRKEASEDLDNASKLKVRLTCPKMEVNLLIPDSSNTKIPYTVSDLHSEYLKLDFVNLLLTTPPSEIDNFTTFGKFDLRCNSITGTFGGLRKDSWKPFFFAEQPKDVPLLSLSYDFRNKSLMNPDEKKSSIFTNKKVFLDSVRLIMPASSDELTKFSHTCKTNSDINIEINLVSANLHFFDKAFFESIYKRFSDLCSFNLRSPAFSKIQEEVSLDGLISTESSFSNDNDDCPINFDSDNETTRTTRKSNKLSLSVLV
uniref:Autophagy-related protein 2 n=1 Tax=Panagrellus redivivus TaxID=6233 RepID=A0A7E4VWH3_PANRE